MSSTQQAIQEYRQIEQVIIRMVNAIDNKQWSLAEEQFTGRVFVDYSSMSGQPGAEVTANELVGGWQSLLSSVSTHHMLSNFEITVTGESAEAMSHVYACHNAEGLDDWDIYGLYRHGLKRQNGDWKIMEMTLMVHGQKGNKAFLQQAGSQ